MDHSFVFWYTGWVIWALIGVVLALTVLIAFIIGAVYAYNGGRQWFLIASYLHMSEEERNVFHSAAHRLTLFEREALNVVFLKHRELLKLLPRGPRMDLDFSGIGGPQWYELNDGSRGRVYGTGGADWLSDGDRTFDMLLETGQDIKIRADGVAQDQPALRILRKCEAPKDQHD